MTTSDNVPPFLLPPRWCGPPRPEHAPVSRAFQGIPSLAISPGGRLWATWYAGRTPAEDENNYVVVATSGDRGSTWSEVMVIDPDGPGPVRAFDPEVWVSPDGRLWSLWAQAFGHNGTVAGVWAMTTEEPESADPVWSAPRRLTDGVMMCKPTVLSFGEWLLPASTWRNTYRSARVVVSTDAGRTFAPQGACDVPIGVRDYEEHMVVERRDGSLWMLVRTSYGIGECVSTDGGRRWSPLVPSVIANAVARFFIRRLQSGNVLLVKHGPVDRQIGRSHLTAYLSRDDGTTWEGGLVLDERAGVSYPDGQQDRDGVIHVVYDRDRTGCREILMARFTEEDVADGSLVSAAGALRMVVSRAS
jgi:hypothetical protein